MVISGDALYSPQETTYGYVILSRGQMLTAITDTGAILWQKGLKGSPTPFLTVTDEDFIYLVTSENELSLINPSGVILWTKKTSFSIIKAPFSGRDGRIYVIGKKNIACFGINGICKWEITLETETGPHSPVTLNDGSILVFCKNLSAGKTQAYRFSPFGTILEFIRFTGIVTASCSCKDGALILFNDGSAGLCSVSAAGKTYTKWTVSKTAANFGKNNNPKIVKTPGTGVCIVYFSGSGAGITILDTANGNVRLHFLLPEFQESESFFTDYKNGLFIADTTTAGLYTINDQTNHTVWETKLPDPDQTDSAWNFLQYSRDGYLILFTTAWTVKGFRMQQRISQATKEKRQQYISKTIYNAFLKPSPSTEMDAVQLDGLVKMTVSEKRMNSLEYGEYAENEISWTSDAQTSADAYLRSLSESTSRGIPAASWFEQNITETSKLIRQLSLFGTDRFVTTIAELLKKETNPSLLVCIVYAAADTAYDPNEALLSALEYTINHSKNNDSVLAAVCDATYSICRFMGRPAFYEKGKELLSSLLYSSYTASVRNYAAENLQKLLILKM
jgi:hypothetical protein